MTIFYDQVYGNQPQVDLDGVFDLPIELFLGGQEPAKRSRRSPKQISRPALDIIEHDDAYEAKLNLAGYKKEELDISIHDHAIKVRTTRQRETEQGKTQVNYLINELDRSLNTERSWKLPAHISENDISASFQDGLLTLSYSKHAPSTPPKKITIS
ncbi:hypothetical protein E3P99_02297 [Wallemia hederae]|uniref:SHSP domain-containing protein n=1 Tax=Wallemia hederae TaxID=1540922 RepID=A0A4T0FQB1_9BASI|nr:hypothetical protein E3P99_02297 [Wallemia hederae]